MQNKYKFRPDSKAKLMDQVKEILRYHHYAYRTEVTYCQWILRYIHYYGGKTHPREMGRHQVEAFLSNLVSKKECGAIHTASGFKCAGFSLSVGFGYAY